MSIKFKSLAKMRKIPTNIDERLRKYAETRDEKWIEPLYVLTEDHNTKVEFCKEFLQILEKIVAEMM